MELVEPESAMVDEGGWALTGVCRTQLSGMVKFRPSAGVKHRRDRIGAVYASDVCQFRGIWSYRPKDL